MKARSNWILGHAVSGLIVSSALTAVGGTNLPPVAPVERSRPTIERASELMGRDVSDSNGKRVGKISDVIVDLDCGRVLYTVVSSSGFIGIGSRQAAVPIEA